MQHYGTVYKSLKGSLIVVTLSTVLWLTGCDRRPQSPPPPPAPTVATLTLQPRKVTLTTELPGRTSAFRVAELRPQVSGLILKRLFTEGSDVKIGQILYQIDPAPFQAALDNSRAALGKAEANLFAIKLRATRFEDLRADKAVSQQECDDAVAALKQAQAEIEYWKAMVVTARINLGYCRVIAPISGRIGRSNVTEGAIVTAYQPAALATIQQLDPIYVDVPKSTTELLRLNRRRENKRLNHDETNQAKVKLILEDGSEYSIKGTLQFSDVTVDPTTGSVIQRIIFPNPEAVLLPGMYARVIIEERVIKQAILVPQQAVLRNRKGSPFSLTINIGNKVEQRMLTLDRAIGDKWLVSAGLETGDRVIVEGTQMARPGAIVKVVPFNETKTRREPAIGTNVQSQKLTAGGS
jgi:membrane fusion protein (multidrug efflux system)